MKYYLSSFKIGNYSKELLRLVSKKSIGFIPNALDFTKNDPERKREFIKNGIDDLNSLGFRTELFDLKEYFNNKSDLIKKLDKIHAIFVCGGNTFILRRAMKICGIDKYLIRQSKNTDFIYSGYSAGVCVLSKSLKEYAICDDPIDAPYDQCKETIWEGLGLIDFIFLPHWNSNHPESQKVLKEIEYCKQNNIPYKAISDGEVIIIE